ncbi:MAG: response regulator [Alphaproteobacteria bacterium]|nr:response regulator [Alphaproteobacteria bacterium]
MTRILIAEHNETVASYLAASLRKGGSSVTVVDNYLEAWRVAAREDFDVLMIDVVMPGVDGFVLAQKVLQDTPDLQVVFITGFAGVAMDMQATPAYAPAPITMRPFHLREAAARIRYLLGQGYLPQEERGAAGEGNVVYADFTRKTGTSQQATV